MCSKDGRPILALPVDERLKVISDPEQRRRMEAGAAATPHMQHLAAWDKLVIVETFTPETERYRGRGVGEIAAELGTSPFETLMGIVLADGLRTTFSRSSPAPTV